MSAAAALFSQSENIPEVSPRGAVARAPAQRSRPSTPRAAGGGRRRPRLTAVSPPGRQVRRCWCGRGRRWDSPSRCSAAAPAQPPPPLAAGPAAPDPVSSASSSESRASRVGFMSLFDENGESRAAGHGGGKMAARPRDPPRVWRSLGGPVSAGARGGARAPWPGLSQARGAFVTQGRPHLCPAGRRKREAGR